MTATRTTALMLFGVCLCLFHVIAAYDTRTVRRNNLAGQRIARGWWYSLKPKNGTAYCGLRDFPPASNGYGPSRLYCILPTYDHYWMWRLLKVDGTNTFTSGDKVFLTIYNPMPYKYCQLRSNVMCGYQNGTIFIIEKTNASGPITLGVDDVVLKLSARYCSLEGSGHNQQLTCNSTKPRATVFQFLASSFAQASLVNSLTRKPCGGYFYPQGPSTPTTVSCSNPISIGFITGLTVALETPGIPLIGAGMNVSFKSYDDTYTYHVATWMQRKGEVSYALEETVGNAQWFSLERLGEAVATGGELLNSTAVALKSTLNGTSLYCGQGSLNSTALVCNLPGPLASLPNGYKFTYNIIP